jgi:hypothetical protein
MASNPLARPPATLIERMSSVADRMRGIGTRLGAYPSRVFLLTYTWTGSEIGRGDPVPTTVMEILPRPMVMSENIPIIETAGGVSEQGVLRVTEISARYTEDELNIFNPTPADNVEIFYEIIRDERDGQNAVAQIERRAYILTRTPQRDPTNSMWTIWLKSRNDDRTRYASRRYWQDGAS